MHILSFRWLSLMLGLTNLAHALYIPPDIETGLDIPSHGAAPSSSLALPGPPGHNGEKDVTSSLVARQPKKSQGSKKKKNRKTRNKKSKNKKKKAKKLNGTKGGEASQSSPQDPTASPASVYCEPEPKNGSQRSSHTKTPKTRTGTRKIDVRSVAGKGRKSGGKLKSQFDDICDWVPRPRISSGNTCDYLVSCDNDEDSEDISLKTSSKSPKSRTSKTKKKTALKAPKHTKHSGQHNSNVSGRSERQTFSIDIGHTTKLETRGEPRRYRTDVAGVQKLEIYSLDYPSNTDLYSGDDGLQHVVLDWNTRGTEKTTGVHDYTVKDYKKIPKDMKRYVTEHLVELQTVKSFIQDQVNSDPDEGAWFEEWWNKELDEQKVKDRTSKGITYGSGEELPPQKTINDLVFQALGSTDNREDFVLCNNEINTYKMRMWSKHKFMDPKKFTRMLTEFKRGGEQSKNVLGVFRAVLGVYSYMNHNEVKVRLNNIFNNVRKELSNIEQLTGEDVNLDISWTAYMHVKIETISEHGLTWLKKSFDEAKEAYKIAIEDITKAEKEYNRKDKPPFLRNRKSLTKLKNEVDTLDEEKGEIDAKIKDAQDTRSNLQDTKYTAIRRRNRVDIARAEEDLDANKKVLKDLKKQRLENEWERNAKQRQHDMHYYQSTLAEQNVGIFYIKEELIKGQEILLAFEKESKNLKLPVLGSQMAVPIRHDRA